MFGEERMIFTLIGNILDSVPVRDIRRTGQVFVGRMIGKTGLVSHRDFKVQSAILSQAVTKMDKLEAEVQELSARLKRETSVKPVRKGRRPEKSGSSGT